mgnify:CR=1 FL=1
MKAKARDSLYESITNDILAELKKGVAPWVKPWDDGGGMLLMPYNGASGHRYRGVNILLLWRASRLKGYASPAWLGYHQAVRLGGYVKRGEKATGIVYASTFVPKDERDKPEAEQRKVPFLKGRDVFNVEQAANLPESLTRLPEPKPLPEAIEAVEVFLRTIGANVLHGGNRAFYSPHLDRITLPEPSAFKSAPDYYATNLHEHCHWTGHPNRLNRDFSGRFGDESYAAEELVAELGAAYLSATLSLPGKLQHAEYIGNWMTLLQHDSRAIFTAASKATGAANFLETKGGRVPGEEEEDISMSL